MRGQTVAAAVVRRSQGRVGNLVRGLEAPFSGPEGWLPASDCYTGSGPPRRNDVSERPRPQPPRPPAPAHERPGQRTEPMRARQRPAQPGSGERRFSCPNFHAVAASPPGMMTVMPGRVTFRSRWIPPVPGTPWGRPAQGLALGGRPNADVSETAGQHARSGWVAVAGLLRMHPARQGLGARRGGGRSLERLASGGSEEGVLHEFYVSLGLTWWWAVSEAGSARVFAE